MRVVWILTILLVVAFFFFAARSSKGERRTRGTRTDALRRKLRALTHDPAVAERLVDAEAARHPELSEAEVLRRVISRLEGERR